MVKENLAKVEKNIIAACERAGRKPDDVTLIAVSKTKPVEMIEEAIEYGKKEFYKALRRRKSSSRMGRKKRKMVLFCSRYCCNLDREP